MGLGEKLPREVYFCMGSSGGVLYVERESWGKVRGQHSKNGEWGKVFIYEAFMY